jgi:hypothetical protein
MAKKILKYQIPDTLKFKIEMPRGARILKVVLQRGVPTLRAMVDNTKLAFVFIMCVLIFNGIRRPRAST